MSSNEENSLDDRFFEAVENGSLLEAESLIAEGADVGSNRHKWEETALHRAIARDDNDMIQLVLKHQKWNLDQQETDYNEAPIHLAAKRSFKVVKQLLEKHVSTTDPNYPGMLPLSLAVEGGNIANAAILLKYSWNSQQDLSHKDRDKKAAKDLTSNIHMLRLIEIWPKINMEQIIDWSSQNLTDESLEKQLKELPEKQICKVLFLSDNPITRIPDLKQYKAMMQLQILLLSDAHIKSLTTMDCLPSTVNCLALERNPIDTLEKDCFISEKGYDLIKNALKKEQLDSLVQPPSEIFMRGWKTVLKYYTQDGDLAKNSHNRLVAVGETCAGKSSLVQSLIKGSPDPTTMADRTQVVEISTWKVSDTDIFRIYDQGGHVIYDITNPLFISRRSTVIHVHNLNDPDTMSRTLQVFRRTLHQHPDNEVHFAMTHIDALSEDDVDVKCNEFQSDLLVVLDKQIDNLDRLTESHLEMDNVQSKRSQHLLEKFKEHRQKIRFFPVSSYNYKGIPLIEKFLVEKAKRQRVSIPESWIKSHNDINLLGEDFLTLSKLEKLLKNNGITDPSDCVRYLNDTGLLLWFEGHPILDNYVFHDVEFLIGALKSMFHHSLREHLAYEKSRKLQRLFDEVEFDEVVEQYEEQGLLQHKLLRYMWGKYNLRLESEKALIEVIKLFHFFHEIDSKPVTQILETTYFVPWLVKNKHPPPSLLDISQPIQINKDKISLCVQCLFHNDVPMNATEMFCVLVQRYAVENDYVGIREAWEHGLYVKVGSREILAYHNEQTSSIYLCVQGRVEELPEVWKTFHFLYESLLTVLDPWNGVVRSLHFICPHCIMQCIDPPNKWPPKQVFQTSSNLDFVTCKKEAESKIPAGLIVMFSPDTPQCNQRIKEVGKFLQDSLIDVFLSYNWGKQQQVVKLYNKLREQGYTCWMDINKMHGGDSLPTEIKKGIISSKVIISCLTTKYSQSLNCQMEVDLAYKHGKAIVPLRLEKEMAWPPQGPMGPVFADKIYIRVKEEDQETWEDKRFEEILKSINKHTGHGDAESELEKKELAVPVKCISRGSVFPQDVAARAKVIKTKQTVSKTSTASTGRTTAVRPKSVKKPTSPCTAAKPSSVNKPTATTAQRSISKTSTTTGVKSAKNTAAAKKK